MTMTEIVFDELHEEGAMMGDRGEEGLSKLAFSLSKEGMKVSGGNVSLMAHLKTASVLCICFPKDSLSKEEAQSVKEFVYNGGGLFLTGEWGGIYGNVATLNSLSIDMGITFNKDRVTDKVQAFSEDIVMMGEVIGKKKIPQFIRITEFLDHPICQGVSEINYFAGCSLEGPESGLLAWSSATSFSDEDANAKWDPGEEVGSLGIAYINEYGSGRVFGTGDTSIISNKYLEMVDNKTFILNVIKWLAKLI